MIRRLPALSRPLGAAARPAPRSPTTSSQARLNSNFGTGRQGSSHPRRWIAGTVALGTTALVGSILLEYYYNSGSVVHEHVVMPVIRWVADPEDGHKIAIRVLSLPSWARPSDHGEDGPELRTEIFGKKVDNPVGVAAGFDKDAQAIDGLFDLGFGYVEVGSVTPKPQPGNPKPRFFRLEEDDAAINRYGFNSLGHGHALGQLRARVHKFAEEHPEFFPSPQAANPLPPRGMPRSLRPGHLLGVNLGKNKTSAADSNDDYVNGVRLLGPYADVVVVNISSPNTPGLRALQSREPLERLLSDVVAERNRIAVDGLPKIAVKVTCDLSDDELADVASAVRQAGVDGVIISNTTIRRKELDLKSENADQVGGLSGRPLFPYALNALRTLRPLLPAEIPIIGAGGIWTGEDAVAMARAGASMVQVYTAFGYRGVGTPRMIKDEITATLFAQPGADTWLTEVGKDHGQLKWDESRVAAEGASLRREAEDLASLISKVNEKAGVAQVVAEAEEALSKLSTGAEKAAHHAAAERATVAAALPDVQAEIDAMVDAIVRIEATPAPVAADVEAVVVVKPGLVEGIAVVSDAPDQPTPQDKWREEVQSGSRRLV